MFLRLLIYYSLDPFLCNLCGGKLNLRVIGFRKWNDPVLNYQQFYLSVLQKCLGRFCFLPRSLLFSDLRKSHFYCRKAIPCKKVWALINTWGASLPPKATAACRLLHSLPLPGPWVQRPVQGNLSLCSVFPSQSRGPGPWGLRRHQEDRRSRELPRLPLGPAFPEMPLSLLLLLFCSRLNNACVFAPFFSCLKRLWFYWGVIFYCSIILHPGLKWSLSVSDCLICFWGAQIYLKAM